MQRKRCLRHSTDVLLLPRLTLLQLVSQLVVPYATCCIVAMFALSMSTAKTIIATARFRRFVGTTILAFWQKSPKPSTCLPSDN